MTFPTPSAHRPVVRRTDRTAPDVVTVVIGGEIDITAVEELRAGLSAAFAPDVRRMVVDASAVTFLDSTGIGALIGARNRCLDASAEFGVVPSAAVRRAFSATGLDTLLVAGADDAEVGAQDDPVA